MSDRAAALVETAIVLPVLLLLFIGGLMLGLATVDSQRLERVTGDAALLSEPDARALVESVGGRIVCWWQGGGVGVCYDDGLTIPRTQVSARGRTWTHPAGTVTPSAQVSRPIPEEPNAEIVDETNG